MVAFLYSRWLALPLHIRVKIATEFGIAKTGSTHVVDNRIESDGYNIKTVEAALEAHEHDWDAIVAKAEGREMKSEGFVGALPSEIFEDTMKIPEKDLEDLNKIVDDTEQEPKKKLTKEHLIPKRRGRPAKKKA